MTFSPFQEYYDDNIGGTCQKCFLGGVINWCSKHQLKWHWRQRALWRFAIDVFSSSWMLCFYSSHISLPARYNLNNFVMIKPTATLMASKYFINYSIHFAISLENLFHVSILALVSKKTTVWRNAGVPGWSVAKWDQHLSKPQSLSCFKLYLWAHLARKCKYFLVFEAKGMMKTKCGYWFLDLWLKQILRNTPSRLFFLVVIIVLLLLL